MPAGAMFTGSFTALITPMREDGSIDEPAFSRFVEWQIGQGVDGIVPVGTTGESPTLTHDEHKRVVEIAIEVAAGRVPVIAGAGSNSTEEAVALASHAHRAGADAVLVVTPYYNKPTQEGLFLHYTEIAERGGLPIIIYNSPSRSVVDLSVETMARLARHPNVVGVKDSTQNLARPLHTRAACGAGFTQFSGEDHTVLAFLASGGHGCISVTANVAPAQCAAMHRAWADGRIEQALAIQDRLLPLHDAMFIETKPAPVKFAASLLGHGTARARLPIAPLSATARDRVRLAMMELGLLSDAAAG
jgi:4-hydroxy-tetrahydrodipicolinate synthase